MGNFKDGLADGEGVEADSLGNLYTGTFSQGKKHGKGIFLIQHKK